MPADRTSATKASNPRPNPAGQRSLASSSRREKAGSLNSSRYLDRPASNIQEKKRSTKPIPARQLNLPPHPPPPPPPRSHSRTPSQSSTAHPSSPHPDDFEEEDPSDSDCSELDMELSDDNIIEEEHIQPLPPQDGPQGNEPIYDERIQLKYLTICKAIKKLGPDNFKAYVPLFSFYTNWNSSPSSIVWARMNSLTILKKVLKVQLDSWMSSWTSSVPAICTTIQIWLLAMLQLTCEYSHRFL